MDSISRFLWRKVAAQVEVTVRPEVMLFKCKDKTESLKTVIYVSPTTRRVISVGDPVPTAEPCIGVDLFRPIVLPGGVDKIQCLEAFLCYAFRAMPIPGWPLIHPYVIFKGADSLDSILCGYQEAILERAAREAGASECEFVSQR
jgi:hypothetical protein